MKIDKKFIVHIKGNMVPFGHNKQEMQKAADHMNSSLQILLQEELKDDLKSLEVQVKNYNE